jgi:hypothetical protein
VSTSGVRVEGLDDFRRGLRKAEKSVKADFRKKERKIATLVVGEARKFAVGEGGSTAHFASSVYNASGSSRGAAVGVRPQANAAFWGAKKRTGWYGARKYRQGRVKRTARFLHNREQGTQHPKWIGNSWEVGGSGGPLAINPAIRHELPTIDRLYLEAIDESSREAFPNGA